jgi:hypothetical protein
MWKILGSDALYVEFAEVWKKRISDLVPGGEKFRELMDDADVSHMMNGSTGEHTFMVELPETVSAEDIQFLADEILAVAKEYEHPFISLDDRYERCQVMFSAEREPEIIGLDKKEGISAGAVFKPILDSWGGAGKNNEFM